MKITHKIGITALGVLAATTVGAVSVYAQTTDTMRTTFISSLATKLGISQDKVQTALDEIHTEEMAQRQTEYETQLTQYVTDGKITEAQKQLIIAKQKELQTQHEQNKDTFQNLTEEERHTKMEAERTALETWAKENNIDMQYLRFGMGKGGHGRGMGPRGMMWEKSMQPTASPAVAQ